MAQAQIVDDPWPTLGRSGELRSPSRISRTVRREHFRARAISRTPRPAASSRSISLYRSTVNFLRDIAPSRSQSVDERYRARLLIRFWNQDTAAPVGPIRGNRAQNVSLGRHIGAGALASGSAAAVPSARRYRAHQAFVRCGRPRGSRSPIFVVAPGRRSRMGGVLTPRMRLLAYEFRDSDQLVGQNIGTLISLSPANDPPCQNSRAQTSYSKF